MYSNSHDCLISSQIISFQDAIPRATYTDGVTSESEATHPLISNAELKNKSQSINLTYLINHPKVKHIVDGIINPRTGKLKNTTEARKFKS